MSNNIFVGLSGGVDSAVSAHLLKSAGYDVTGVFIKVWQPDFVPCTWKEDRLDAMRVAAHLGIKFETLDLEGLYKREVIDYMVNEYKFGRTPNPDVFCNKEVKFGGFLKWAMDNGTDYIATGHYAKVINHEQLLLNNSDPVKRCGQASNELYLRKGVDKDKDQSYFLWTLTQEQLKHCIFPLGNMNKTEVRKIAKKLNLPNALKRDSQGLCFVSNVNMKDFLKHFIDIKRGDVLSTEGEIIGEHSGAVFYTIGERHGFEIGKRKGNQNGPFFVVDKDIESNTITVSDHDIENNGSKIYKLNNENWISKILPDSPYKLTANVIYHGKAYPCRIDKNTVIFEEEVLIASGQSIVFYNNDICLGGAIIEKSL